MPAITQILFSGDEIEIRRGTLFHIPPELIAPERMAAYRRAKLGWSECDLGFSVYAKVDALGKRLVIPGIILEDRPKPRRKYPGYTTTYTRQQIEKYVEPHLSRTLQIRSERDLLFRRLTHDLRAISTEIYHEALAARDAARSQQQHKLADAMDIVLGSQQLMSVRLDIVDYESGQAVFSEAKPIAVFKKVEKVYRAFQRKARAKAIKTYLHGNSFSFVSGFDTFEIAVFVLIENAVKYSPHEGALTVEVTENDSFICVSVASYGPKIGVNERKKIFESGERGAAAKRLKMEGGSGIGLFAAHSIVVGQLGGGLSVAQEPEAQIFGNESYYETTFFITLPISLKRERPVYQPSRRIRRSPQNFGIHQGR